MRTIAIANQKGGCGKTTTAVNLAAAMCRLHKEVLIVDLDPQAHATVGLGIDPELPEKTIYDVIARSNVSISESVVQTNCKGLTIAPSNVLLSGAEFELAGRYGREYMLRQRLLELNGTYDLCIIDCSPSLSLLTINALAASSDVLIPVQTQYYALEGLKQLLDTIDIVKTRYNPSLNILGVLLTFVESQTALSRHVQKQMRQYFKELVFETVIHKTVRLAEAPSAGQSIISYDSRSRGAKEYMALAEEITSGKE